MMHGKKKKHLVYRDILYHNHSTICLSNPFFPHFTASSNMNLTSFPQITKYNKVVKHELMNLTALLQMLDW